MSIRCEICGRVIYGKPHIVEIEGAVLKVCSECAKLGKPPRPSVTARAPAARKAAPTKLRPYARSFDVEDLIIDPNYHTLIRKAREKLGLTQEELARKIGEKTSVVSKIESGKLRPTIPLARKLEHALKIKIVKTLEELELE